VTRKNIQVHAQWALHGKTPDHDGYRLLACSDAELSRHNFEEALSRFTPGTLDALPQVSLSYLRRATMPGGSYLALAIHRSADEGRGGAAAGLRQFDTHGRETVYTSYFSVPYRQLAAEGVTYQDMYRAFSATELPAKDGPPIAVSIPAPTALIPAADDLAMRTAALLLTGSPVCVLGADATGFEQRLAFIDTVMSLLPYGLRSRMAAATWTRATQRQHHFRLFFSSTPRQPGEGARAGDSTPRQPDEPVRRADERDLLVTWGRPEDVSVPAGDPRDYLAWLQDKVNPLARLTELTAELGLGQPTTPVKVFELINLARLKPGQERRAESQSAPPAADVQEPTAESGEALLLACAAAVIGSGEIPLRTVIGKMEQRAKTGLDDRHRPRYRELIAEHGLLRPQPRFSKWEGRLYEQLLALGFGVPLSYDGYCLAEDCLGNPADVPPHQALLEAIDRVGVADPLAKAIVYWHLRKDDEKKLNKWFFSGDVDPEQLIHLLARDEWRRLEHTRAICDVTLEFLQKAPARYDQGKLRNALRQHGFLARVLHMRYPANDQYQIHALYRFLAAAYPNGLDRPSIAQVLRGTSTPPTPALLAAVLMQVSKPGDWRLAWDSYVYGSLTLISVAPGTSSRLEERLPPIDSASLQPPMGHS
jgi:hypothetical protein